MQSVKQVTQKNFIGLCVTEEGEEEEGERKENTDKMHSSKFKANAHVDGRSKCTRTPENYMYT